MNIYICVPIYKFTYTHTYIYVFFNATVGILLFWFDNVSWKLVHMRLEALLHLFLWVFGFPLYGWTVIHVTSPLPLDI